MQTINLLPEIFIFAFLKCFVILMFEEILVVLDHVLYLNLLAHILRRLLLLMAQNSVCTPNLINGMHKNIKYLT